jgi:hypothetical protein
LVAGGVNGPDLDNVLTAVVVKPTQFCLCLHRGGYLEAVQPDAVADDADIVGSGWPINGELFPGDLRRRNVGHGFGRFRVLNDFGIIA